jgi:hypothetical protein
MSSSTDNNYPGLHCDDKKLKKVEEMLKKQAGAMNLPSLPLHFNAFSGFISTFINSSCSYEHCDRYRGQCRKKNLQMQTCYTFLYILQIQHQAVFYHLPSFLLN